MRSAMSLILLMCPAVAHAHTGHLGTLAGHDHWVAGAALGAAVAVAAWGLWKGKAKAKTKGTEAPKADEAKA